MFATNKKETCDFLVKLRGHLLRKLFFKHHLFIFKSKINHMALMHGCNPENGNEDSREGEIWK